VGVCAHRCEQQRGILGNFASRFDYVVLMVRLDDRSKNPDVHESRSNGLGGGGIISSITKRMPNVSLYSIARLAKPKF
jgi:hypothetical protein